MNGIVVDNFAGGGGASLGIRNAGLSVAIAINHDPQALAMYAANEPGARLYCENVWDVNPRKVVADAGGGPVSLAWFSPDCKHFSKAKGGRPVEKNIRGLAWVACRWAAAVRPAVIILENVEEFAHWGPLDDDNKPCQLRKGQTFRRWTDRLAQLGYAVEWRELRACDYGVPTIRKRLFLVARCDGSPIRWPEPTHARPADAEFLGLRPWRSAAECIDWLLPCPSIFDRKRPLADATLRRIANGIVRYVIEAKEPFIVRTGHYSNITGDGAAFRGQPLARPMSTITGINDKALVMPSIVRIGQTGGSGKYCNGVAEPLTTITSKAEHCLVAAFLAKHYGGVVGSKMSEPVSTVTATDHNALTAASLVKFRGTCRAGQDARAPMPTITSGGNHVAEVRAFLIKYYGSGASCQGLFDPMHTVTSRDRLGLVTVAGTDYQIVDIGMRMLQPRELFRAQGFGDDYVIDPINPATGRPLSKRDQVRMCGNSVCPQLAEAIVRANVVDMRGEVAA